MSSAPGTRENAASNRRWRRSRSGGGMLTTRGRSGDLASDLCRSATESTPSTQTTCGLAATSSRNHRSTATNWVRKVDRASSPVRVSRRSTKMTRGPLGALTEEDSRSSSFSGLNTRLMSTSVTWVPARLAASRTSSLLPQPFGPSSNMPATAGSFQDVARSCAVASSENQPVTNSTSLSSPASKASAVDGCSSSPVAATAAVPATRAARAGAASPGPDPVANRVVDPTTPMPGSTAVTVSSRSASPSK